MDSEKKPPASSGEITKPPGRNLLDEPTHQALHSEEITIPPGSWTPERAASSLESGKLTLEVRLAGGIRQAPVSTGFGRLLVGRTQGEVQIHDRMVSHRHASIEWQEGQAPVLTDLGSTNGTFLNGHKLDGPETLEDKDEIRVGSTYLSVRLAGGAGGR